MTNSSIRHFADLIAWQKSHYLTLKVYQLTNNFPKEEMFGLISQLRRAASSITCNIAEGYGRYHYNDKIRFYYQARGSNMEVQNLLILSNDLGYIDKNIYQELKSLAYEGYKLLNGLINSTGNFN